MPLSVNEARDSFSLHGEDVEPLDLSWSYATTAQRRAYYQLLGAIVRRLKLAELARGVGVNGRRLRSVQPESRPDGATGPPLSPHGRRSRIQRYLRPAFASDRRCTLYWDPRWRMVVRGHRIGWGKLPVRDVVGLTTRDFNRAVAEARADWARRQGPLAPPPPTTAPPAPIPLVARPARR